MPSPAFAATLRGTVTDPSHAVIAGATVAITNEDTGTARSATTNLAGIFSFAELAVGSYRVDVSFSGFKTSVIRGIRLDVGDARSLEVVLEIGDVQEHVGVDGSALAVKTVGGEVAGLVGGEEVRELPLNGRNFLQLMLLMPGVSPSDGLNLTDKGMLSLVNLSVSGGGATSNLFTVDGVNDMDVGANMSILVSPSVDAIEEFKVHRNSYGAEYGQAAGAQVDIVTRGGTNRFQGSAYYFGRNDVLDATNYFLLRAGQPKEKLRYHDFGFTVGGPVVKDKLHFFVSEEWNRSLRGTVRSSFVPTAAEREGDFSGPPIPGCTPPLPLDPLTGQRFAGGRIPADRLSPGGLLLVQLYPLPNTTPAPGTCNNWVQSLDTPTRWRQDSIRMDWSVGARTRVLLRYTQDAWRNEPPGDADRLWGDPYPAVDASWREPGRSLLVELSRDLGSNAVNTLAFSWSGNRIDVTPGGSDPSLNARINTAIPTIYPADIKSGGIDHAHAVFWGSQGYGALIDAAPWNNRMDLLAFRDDYSQTFGKHLLKAGIHYSFNRKDEVAGDAASEAAHFGIDTGLGGFGPTTGNIVASLLLRDMSFFSFETSANVFLRQRWQNFEAYLSDSWKVHPRLHVDAGVRLSYLGNPYAIDDVITSFDPAAFDPTLGGDPCNGLLQVPGKDPCAAAGFTGGAPGPNRALIENRLVAAPRLGVAWDVFGDGGTAIRAGGGQYFLREAISRSLSLSSNPPFARSVFGIRALDTSSEPCAGCLSSATGVPSYGREARGLVPNNWQWSLTLEQRVWRGGILELSYVGSRGVHLNRGVDVNMVPSGDANRNGIADRLEYVRAFGDPAAAASLRPFGVFGDTGIGRTTSSGSSIYHGLQTQLRTRFGHGSQFQASYTFSRLISNTALDASNEAGDPEDPNLDRGLSPFSRKHLFNASLVLELPGFAGRTGVLGQVLGGWEIAAILVAASGAPLTVYNGLVPGISGVSGTGAFFSERPNRATGQPCRASGGPREQWLNPAAFTLADFALGTFGNAGRGICEGPGLGQTDLAFYKSIGLGKKVKAQLRFEVFNVFNRVQFLNVDNTLDPLSVTLDGPLASATRVIGYEPSLSFGQATKARDPRQVQFGMKLLF
jgi:hypothetical protein